MRVAIVGAGIIGVATAYELALLGAEVTVFERRGGVAAEASFAHAGIISAAGPAPWTTPLQPAQGWRSLLGTHSPVRLAGLHSAAQLPWLWRWWRAGQAGAPGGARGAALRTLAQFSRDRMLELARTLDLEFEQMPGCLVLLRSESDLDQARTGLALLRASGMPHEVIDAGRCHALEPGLQRDTALHAAIHLPHDGVGNCRQFAQLLKAQAQRLGVHFRFQQAVTAVEPGPRPAIVTAAGSRDEFDAAVICAGAQAHSLLVGLKLELPLLAFQGCSVTAPLRVLDGQPRPGPRAAVIDLQCRTTLVRLGQRIRVVGATEVGGSPDRIAQAALAPLYRVLDDWFPGAAVKREAQHWKGAMPVLPDGAPVLGASGAAGVWLNLGHGSSGWSLACGSARLLAASMTGGAPAVDVGSLSPRRFG